MIDLKSKLIAGAAALLIIGGGFLYIKSLKAENARLEQVAVYAQAEAASLKDELTANHAALAKREAEKALLAAETETLKTELEAIYENDNEAKTWASDNIPNSILARLR